mmetsp:Transcript_16788/g.50159  ORF Transcript_16788/g.50159 Transcript_16788/m.50159 type:complete len:222 (-) Transcript_16788:829-1494(-)
MEFDANDTLVVIRRQVRGDSQRERLGVASLYCELTLASWVVLDVLDCASQGDRGRQQRLALQAQNDVAILEARPLRSAAVHHLWHLHPRLPLQQRHPHSGHLGKQDGVGEDDVEHDAAGNDQGTVQDGAVLQQVWIVLGILAFLFFSVGLISREPHEATQGDCPQAVLHVIPRVTPQNWAKPNGKFRDVDALGPGSGEVAQLMDRHNCCDHPNCRCHPPGP